jgi:glutaredoxin
MKSNKTLLTIIITVLVAGAGLYLISRRPAGEGPSKPGQYDQLAQCLTDKGAKFYGAYWCPHCAEQKRILGDSMKKINYVECAIPGNQQGQTVPCQDAKIESYPTWVFADGSRVTGVQQVDTLAEKTGCKVDETPAQ